MLKAACGAGGGVGRLGVVTWSLPGARLKINGWLVPWQVGEGSPHFQATLVR